MKTVKKIVYSIAKDTLIQYLNGLCFEYTWHIIMCMLLIKLLRIININDTYAVHASYARRDHALVYMIFLFTVTRN